MAPLEFCQWDGMDEKGRAVAPLGFCQWDGTDDTAKVLYPSQYQLFIRMYGPPLVIPTDGRDLQFSPYKELYQWQQL